MTTTPPLDLETELDMPFSSSEWINRGQRYAGHADAPLHVYQALLKRTGVPDAYIQRLPSPGLTVEQFLRVKLPSQSFGLEALTIARWFSNERATSGIELLLSRPIPPASVLDDMWESIGQAWFNGAQSISDPRFSNGKDRFPLWAVTFWRRMCNVVIAQGDWRERQCWLEEKLSTTIDYEMVAEARRIFESLSWDAPATGFGVNIMTSKLATLLGEDWISEDIIDMMMSRLAARVRASPSHISSHTIIGTLAFSAAIKFSKNRSTHHLLRHYEDEVKTSGKSLLLFPIHSGGNHWIAGFIDFERRTFGYGDSRHRPTNSANPLSKGLRTWLREAFGHNFEDTGDSLSHPVQTDVSSCSMCVENTVAHKVFGDPLWMQDQWAISRVRWFCTLSMACHKPAANAIVLDDPNIMVKLFESPDTILVAALGDHNFSSSDIMQSLRSSQSSSNVYVSPTHSTVKPTISNLLNPVEEECAADTSIAIPLAETDDLSIPSTRTMDLNDSSFATSPVSSFADFDEPGSFGMQVDDNPELSLEPDQPLTSTITSRKRSMTVTSAISQKSQRTAWKFLGGQPKKPKKEEVKPHGISGISISATSARKSRAAEANGEVDFVDAKKWEKWKKKILSDDPGATFFETEPRRIDHSRCGNPVKVKNLYDCSRWNTHLRDCDGIMKKRTLKEKAQKNIGSLFNFGFNKNVATSTNVPDNLVVTYPCPGLTRLDEERVPTYLQRSGAMGGGSRSIMDIARTRFAKLFSRLGKNDKASVLLIQQNEHTWRNDHQNLRVFSTTCRGEVVVGKTGARKLPCDNCHTVLVDKRFKQVLRKPTPSDENYIYVNHRFRNQLLGKQYAKNIGLRDLIENSDAKNTPCVRYAQGVLSGKYDDTNVFGGLVHAMMTKLDREERGVGMQNFCYPPAYDEFMHIINIHSPRAHRFLQAYLPARTHRSIRIHEARKPRFPMSIGDKTFELVHNHLRALEYTGEVGLSCDDTKLTESTRLYWDAAEKCHYLVGAVGGPIRVLDPEKVQAILDDPATIISKKVRLWCLQIPLPKCPPIIVAAIPIGDFSADVLLPLLTHILFGLLDLKIKVVSYACDGTAVERRVQTLLTDQADSYITYTVKSPRRGFGDVEIRIPVFCGQPVVMIQDSKHGLKTFRNNLFTGARLLTFGNFPAMYSHIRVAAFKAGSPLYHRDVEKTDKQDDNAAARLFSAASLQWIGQEFPEYIGDIVYLFVFGELIDAYQSRTMGHDERLQLVLRARYYIDFWQAFITTSGYTLGQHCISHAALDIARFLIEGLISLVIVYRDRVHDVLPLLPWLHSSEACEHVFGESRFLIENFALLDFYFMVPKLNTVIREAVLRGQTTSGKATASGYCHTYFDTGDTNLAELAKFPSNTSIQQAAARAADEADSLIHLLGIEPRRLHHILEGATPTPHLPSINEWYIDDDDEFGSEYDPDELNELMNMAEEYDLSTEDDAETFKLTCAAFSLAADNMMKVQGYEYPTEEEAEEHYAEHCRIIGDVLTQSLPPVNHIELSSPYEACDLDFKQLVDMRRRHQTKQAASGIRTKQDQGVITRTEQSVHHQLVRRFNEVLREYQPPPSSHTKKKRNIRWESGEPTTTGHTPAAGNSANAAAAASAATTKATTRRRSLFAQANIPNAGDIALAGVSILKPLQPGDYGIVFTTAGLMIGRVLAIYVKSGGAGGKHGSVKAVERITQASYIAVQLFEHSSAEDFLAIPGPTALLGTLQFAHLPSHTFLFALSPPPFIHANGDLKLSPGSSLLFRDLKAALPQVKDAMRLFGKRKPKPKPGHQSDTDEDT